MNEIIAEITPQQSITAYLLSEMTSGLFVPYSGALADLDMGSFSVFANNLYTKTEINGILTSYYTSSQIDAILTSYAKLTDLHDPVTLGVNQNGLSLVGQILSLGLASNSTNGALSSTDWNIFNGKQNALGYTPENIANKGVSNGYASLDSGGKVPMSQLPTSIMEYKGSWNATTNIPALADGTGDTGDTYRTSVEGTQNLGSGAIHFYVGDFVIYNGSIRERSPTANGVVSVFGRTGAIVAQSGDYTSDQITETLNKVFVTPSEKIAITHTNRSALDLVSGTNTGDETQSSIITKIGNDVKTTGNPTFNSINFALAPTGIVPAIGQLYWNAQEDCLSFGVTGGSIEIGKENFDYYTNLSGVTLVDGDVVSIVGVSGNRVAVSRTDATNAQNSTACIGMVTNGAGANQTVRVTKAGMVHGLNTDSFIEGLPLYVDPLNPGKLTQTPPNAPNFFINVGIVLVKHAVNGVIDVVLSVSPRMQDLSNVNGTALTTSGQIAVRDNTNKYFDFTKNINNYEPTLTFSTGLTRATSTITANLSTGIAGGQSVIGSILASENLTLSSTAHTTKGFINIGTTYYDETANRRGFGTTSPTHTITLATSSTGISVYNTADQVTNYERLAFSFESNIANIFTSKNGTGTNRSIRIGQGVNNAVTSPSNYIQIGSTSTPAIFNLVSGTFIGTAFFDITTTLGHSSGLGTVFNIKPTISQSGSAGYTSLLINPTETSIGTGAKNLLLLQVGGSTKALIDNAGTASFSGGFTTGTVVVSTNTSLTSSHQIVIVSALATITLPTAVGITGRQYNIIRSGTANVTIATTSSQTISGDTSLVLTNQWDSVVVVSDGSNRVRCS